MCFASTDLAVRPLVSKFLLGDKPLKGKHEATYKKTFHPVPKGGECYKFTAATQVVFFQPLAKPKLR